MIAIVSSNPRERSAFAALCDNRSWTYTECESARAFRKMLSRGWPRVVLTRHKLSDGYSDDVMAALAANSGESSTKVVVLLSAGTPSAAEVRQVALGSDCVLRDPVRTDVLSEYLLKYLRVSKRQVHSNRVSTVRSFKFATGHVHPVERTFSRGKKTAHLTPREVELSQLLAHSPGEVVTYESLYGEILGRKFRGETSNLRVLLGKLDVSARKAGLNLREWIEVIPKLGYRYRDPSGKI